jgi:hypothetical protein
MQRGRVRCSQTLVRLTGAGVVPLGAWAKPHRSVCAHRVHGRAPAGAGPPCAGDSAYLLAVNRYSFLAAQSFQRRVTCTAPPFADYPMARPGMNWRSMPLPSTFALPIAPPLAQ